MLQNTRRLAGLWENTGQTKGIGSDSGVGSGLPFYVRWLGGNSATSSHLINDLKEVRERAM